ncbi:MAG: hypothetical protein ACR2L2_06870 [Acidobacteriota bacterium]
MRTTIEVKEEHRAKLLELAARRGEKGFSSVIAEAIEAHLGAEHERTLRRRRALQLRGSFSAREISSLREDSSKLRKSWR